MEKSVIEILQNIGALGTDKQPMKIRQYDLSGGVPIIDLPRGNSRGLGPDVIIYDNVTSPDGVTLIQGSGKAYHGSVRNGELAFEVERIEHNKPFGAIGIYPDDYYTANRDFVDGLRSR